MNWLGISNKTRLKMQARMEKRFQSTWNSLTLERIAPHIQIPGLVIHDRGDKDAPYEDGASIHQLWRGSEMHTTVGLGHHRILRAAPVIDCAIEFLNK
jgi:pimeloyl-ACP methyl ester carboxylesterase